MTLEIPPEIPAWVVSAVAGPWPKGDEDGLRRLGHAWIVLGEAITAISYTTGHTRRRAIAAIEGQLAHELTQHGIDLEANLNDAAKACHGLGEQCIRDALYTECGKYVIIGSLAALAIQLAADLFIPGIGQVQATAATAATRLTVRAAFRDLITSLGTDGARAAAARMVKVVVFKGATMGAIQGGLIPLGADIAQMMQGSRRSGDFDWDQIGLGAVTGAAAGIAGEFVGARAMTRLEKTISTDRFVGRSAVRLVGAAAGGSAGTVSGAVATVPFTGELDLGWNHVLMGAVGGALGSMPHALLGPTRSAIPTNTHAPAQSKPSIDNGRATVAGPIDPSGVGPQPKAQAPQPESSPPREATTPPDAPKATPRVETLPVDSEPRSENRTPTKTEAPQYATSTSREQATQHPLTGQRQDIGRPTPIDPAKNPQSRTETTITPTAEPDKTNFTVSAPQINPHEIPPAAIHTESRTETTNTPEQFDSVANHDNSTRHNTTPRSEGSQPGETSHRADTAGHQGEPPSSGRRGYQAASHGQVPRHDEGTRAMHPLPGDRAASNTPARHLPNTEVTTSATPSRDRTAAGETKSMITPRDHERLPESADIPPTRTSGSPHLASSTEAGVSFHLSDPVLAELAAQIARDPNYFTVDVHITADGHARVGDRIYTPEEFANLLHRTNWGGENSIRLIGCEGATNGFASHLARHLGVDVLAPTRPAWSDTRGRVYTSSAEIQPDGTRRPRIPPDGFWEIHRPDGTKYKATEDGFAPGSRERDTQNLIADEPKDRGDGFISEDPVAGYDQVEKDRVLAQDDLDFNERFVEWNRPTHQPQDPNNPHIPREPIAVHDVIKAPHRERDTVPDGNTNPEELRPKVPDTMPEPLRGLTDHEPLRPWTAYPVENENTTRTTFFTDGNGTVKWVEATAGSKSQAISNMGKWSGFNPDLSYPLLPEATYRVPNFRDVTKMLDFHTDKYGQTDSMTGDVEVGGQDRNHRDDDPRKGAQQRAYQEGEAAYPSRPGGVAPTDPQAKANAQVRWAGGHLLANALGGLGEYLNMHPQMAASNSGNARDRWIHAASWRAKEDQLIAFAAVEYQSIGNYQVKMIRRHDGVPDEVVMRWQEITYERNRDGGVRCDDDGKPVVESVVTKERVFPNNPNEVNFGPDTRYSGR
ncbi:hypothetical protein ACFVUS_27280 [Nocardia sp. NPDC058058]|uniref:WXG100-like domain-containing protein n=1 Tax=Nocardia sp. NPDC058058 TaxID=3346317 RepID=UPI0036DEB15F